MTFIIVSAVLAGLAVLALLIAVRGFIDADQRIGTRLDAYVGTVETSVVVPTHSTDNDGQNPFAERLNRSLSDASFAERIRRDLARANVPLTVPEYVLLKLASTLLPTALIMLLTGSLLAVPVIALIGFFLPTLWLIQRRRQRSRLFEEQLPEALATMISSLRAGFSLPQSLGNVARESPEPVAGEMRRVVQEIQLGLSVNDALSNLAQRMESDDLELIVAVLKIHTRVGGSLTTVLENISTTIRERTRLRREIRVITAQQRYASYVLGLLPVILALILLTINPDYMMKLFRPGWTLCIPIAAAVFTVAGFLVIRRIVDIKV